MRITIIYIFSLFTLLSCSKTLHLTTTEVSGVRVTDDAAEPDAAISQFIEPYKKELDAKMSQVIGVAANHIDKGKPESTLGNLLSDMIQKAAQERSGKQIDFSIQNYGGIRIGSIPKGEITVGRIFELMPFDNLISIVEVPGMWMDTLINRFARDGGWPISRELRFEMTESREAKKVLIAGKPLDHNRTYSIAMPDYIANGGGSMFFLRDFKKTDLDYLIRDAIIDWIKEQTAAGEQIDGVKDGRITKI